MGDVIQSLKEFIWEIIGFLIPGFLFLLILNFVLLQEISVDNKFLFSWNIFNNTYIIIVLAYALGFVIYCISDFKVCLQDYIIEKLYSIRLNDNFFTKMHSKYWEIEFENSATLKSAKERLERDNITHVSDMEINELRNIFISRNPDMERTVYTFMFRSTFFNQISTIMLSIIILAILQFILEHFNILFIKLDSQYILFYILFLFILKPLGDAKRKFNSISNRIPFSNLK